MKCTSADHQKYGFGKRLWSGAICAVVCVVSVSDNAMAETAPLSDIGVTCSGSDTVSAQSLGALCDGLHHALATLYPDARFVLIDRVPADAEPFVALETFTANETNIEARLIWQAAGLPVTTGPRAGISIIDKTLTPAMHQTFLNRLVQDAALPF